MTFGWTGPSVPRMAVLLPGGGRSCGISAQTSLEQFGKRLRRLRPSVPALFHRRALLCLETSHSPSFPHRDVQSKKGGGAGLRMEDPVGPPKLNPPPVCFHHRRVCLEARWHLRPQ